MPRKPTRRKFYGVPSNKIPLGTPEAMIEAIENESQGVPPTDRYRARIAELRAEAMRTYGDPDGCEDASHLRETRAGLSWRRWRARPGSSSDPSSLTG
jgi:hypothetical protein